MTFRKVIVPMKGPVDDYQVTLGGSEDGAGYAESPHQAYISGAFQGGTGERYYLIGKYEVSKVQYAALSTKCPKANVPGRLPQASVSWMGSMTFAEGYTNWLLKNAKDALPRENGTMGYLRLPTDVEWEFAARGGMAVAPSDFQERLYPMTGQLAQYAWFSGSKSANGRPQLTGMLKPNPLGLHDILGNVDEMTFDAFRLNKLDRAHGQAGGFSVRGGNYFTNAQSMRTAYRIEQPFFTKKGSRKSKTTGFRLVISAPVVTSKERLAEIQAAWAKLGSIVAKASAPTATASEGGKVPDDPIEELGAIIDSLEDKDAKKRLSEVRLAMRSSIQARDQQRGQAAKAALRLGTFLAIKIKRDSVSVLTLAKLVDRRLKNQQGGASEDKRLKRYKDQMGKEQATLDGNLRYYADTVISVADSYPTDVLQAQTEVLGVEVKSRGAEASLVYAQLFLNHVLAYKLDMRVSRKAWLQQLSDAH